MPSSWCRHEVPVRVAVQRWSKKLSVPVFLSFICAIWYLSPRLWVPTESSPPFPSPIPLATLPPPRKISGSCATTEPRSPSRPLLPKSRSRLFSRYNCNLVPVFSLIPYLSCRQSGGAETDSVSSVCVPPPSFYPTACRTSRSGREGEPSGAGWAV